MRRVAQAVIVSLCLWLCMPLSCSAGGSQPEYGVVEELDVRVTMRDGVCLSTNIYRPDAEGRFPVLLSRTPYGNEGDARDGRFFAERGYVAVLQDTRGRYESEGAWEPGRWEGVDGYDTQQWVVEQPWCNGKIGTFGGSYVGFTQWMPATLGCPNLVTMFPALALTDWYDLYYQGGAFRLQLNAIWQYMMTAPYDFDVMAFATGKMAEMTGSLPLMEQDKVAGWRVAPFRDGLAHPEFEPYWHPVSMLDGYKNISASVYAIAGWFDMFTAVDLKNFVEMTKPYIAPEVRARQKIIIGPWTHSPKGDGKAGELDFGQAAMINVGERRLQWFDSQLKGMDTEIMDEPPVKVFVMGANVWRDEQEWPLARAEYRKYYLHSNGKANTRNGDGRLSTEAAKDEPTDSFVYDPENPVPTATGLFNPFDYGPADHSPIEDREDVLVYSTPPLESDVEVTGPIEVVLYAASSAVNTDYTAKLLDVYPDGRAMRLCEGIIRASFRKGDTETSNIEPGKVYEYLIDLWATSNVFLRGHRIRVEVSSSNFPRFDRNLNTGSFFASDTTWVKAEQTIYHTEKYPSCIVLPIIE